MINLKAQPCDELAIRATRYAHGQQRGKHWILAATILGSTMAFVDASVVNVALPRMESDLGTTLSAMTWVINAYTLCMAALLLIGGAAADRLGRRLIFLCGVAVFALASIGCGFAPNVRLLVLARAVQGAGAALLVPCSLAIIGATFEDSERGAAIGIWSGFSAIAAGGGPLLGGWLVDHGSWRAIFLINPLLAIVTIAIALRHLPESRDPEASSRLDWAGALLAFCGLGTLVHGLMAAAQRGWSSHTVLLSLCIAAALLGSFLLVERHAAAPMMPLTLFRSRSFSGVNLLTLLLYGALGGALFLLPFLLIQVHGYSATAAGGVFLPFTLVLGALSRWGGGLVQRFGARGPLVVGPVLVSAALVLLALPGTGGRYWQTFLLPMMTLGLGMAITVAPLTATVLDSVAARQSGVASGINNAVAQLASLLLVALFGAVGIGILDRSLDAQLADMTLAPAVRQLVAAAHGGFVLPPIPLDAESAGASAHAIITHSFVHTMRRLLLSAAGLALASAACAALMIGPSSAGRGPMGVAAR